MFKPHFFLNSNYVKLNFRIVFGINFGPWEAPQPEMHGSEITGVLVWAIPEVKIRFRKKKFLNLVLYNYCSIFFIVFFLLKWHFKYECHFGFFLNGIWPV